MTIKRCFKCGTRKPLEEFYKHAQMRDGHLNKCKTCAKRDVRQHRAANNRVREYDIARAKLPRRRQMNAANAKKWREECPEGYRAQTALNNAVRDGKITKQPCEQCGATRVHGHHRDYSKPLDVIWLCALHHHKAHGLTRAL